MSARGAAAAPRAVFSARGALLVVLLGGLFLSSAFPAKQLWAQRDHIAELQAEERAIRDKVRMLQAEVALLGTDAEIERLAREELGMVRPGEIAFAVAPKARKVSSATRGVAPPQADEEVRPPRRSLGSRWWDAFVRALSRAF